MNTPVEQLTFIKKVGQSEAQKKAIAGSYTRFSVIGSDTNLLKPITQYSLKVPDAVSITPVAVSGGVLAYASSQYEPRMNFSYYTSSESKGLLETEAAEKGAAIQYTYDTNLLLQTRTEAYGTVQQQTTTYLHNELFGVKEITNPRGIITEFAYDNLGRLLTVKDLAGNIVKAYDYQYFSYPSNLFNSVTEFTPRVASGSLPSGIANLQTSIGYVDGLGRTLQNVGKEAGPNGSSDIVVNAQTYDATGRPKRTYVAFANAGSGGLATLPATVHGDAAPYSLDSLFDNSPLKRVTKSYGPGQAWRTADKAVLMNYGTVGSEVPNITVTSTGTANSGNYNNYVLFKKTTTNERSLTSFEFSDKNGQVVERWTPDTTGGQYLKTSYVYDDLGRLRYVIQPQARHTTTAFNEMDAVFTHYVFAYQYDRRGRVIRKHTPGGGWTNIVYDALDRVVLQQDAQQAAESTPKWTFIKYDALGRTIQTGETTNGTDFTTLQQQVDADNDQFEVRNTSSGSYYYTQLTTPSVASNEVHSINYYDDYTNWRASDLAFLSSFQSQYTSARGLLTGTAHRLLDGSNQWFYKAHYYNYRDQVIQTRQREYPSLAHYVQTDVDYNFALQVTQQNRLYQKQGTSDVLVKEAFEYDHVGRRTRYRLGLNSANLDTIAHYQYDAVGRLITKTIRPTRTYQKLSTAPFTVLRNAAPPANTNDVASKWIVLNPNFSTTASGSNTYTATIGTGSGTVQGLQTIQYSYHIRDWLSSLNSGSLNTNENDLFAMSLDYEADGTYYDGNIRKQNWVNKFDQQTRSYTYGYDLANRLKQATYAGNGSENYALPLMQYDKNGNITTLQRNGKDGSGFGAIDRLSYNYTGNRLSYVNDAITTNENVGDFRNDNTGTDDYIYWADGSLKTDKNKGITQIDYNFLDLPQQVQLGGNKQVAYVYDGNGRKVEKKTTVNGNPQSATYYLDNALYEKQGAGNYGLYQIGHEEGRIVPINDTLRLEFSYTDQLGSLRLSFRDSLASPQAGIYKAPVITQISQTDPWGWDIRALGFVNQSVPSKHIFTGKELQAEFGYYDFGARMSDPTIGNRFLSIDPLTDEQEAWNPYHYTYNNPVNYVDLFGLSPSGAFESNAITICPTCPKDPKYDEYRNSKSLYTYDKETGIILNGDGKGATVYGRRNQEPTFNGWGHLFGPSMIIPAAEFPKSWIGKATVGNASEVTTPVSYLSNKLLGNESMQKLFKYSNVMSKRLYTHSRMINGKLVRFKTNLLGRYVGRWLGFGLSRVSMAVTVYDIVDTANTNFQNMTLEEQYQLLQTQQMSGSFIPKELIQEQREIVKK
jgi:RHS repeat-associated protein